MSQTESLSLHCRAASKVFLKFPKFLNGRKNNGDFADGGLQNLSNAVLYGQERRKLSQFWCFIIPAEIVKNDRDSFWNYFLLVRRRSI